ncbi:MAG TPA: GAF domain-containing protein [Chloroflexota bacterium]|jgi:DNA-binding CsgD family transcriptional regulator/putative methionine-R-sulfoxide reductase with GAF domain|nr:GAF domain-containing protein [Chloroflexota bacterium]
MLHELSSPRQELSPNGRLTARSDERAVLDALAEVGVAFTTERQLDPVLDRLLESALNVVRADAGSVMLLSRERDTLVVVAARGPRARTILGTRQPADRSVAGWALRAGETVLLHGSASEQPASDHPRELASAVVVPLALGGRLVGVLNASREPGATRMDERSARLLELLANQAAILIDSAQMLEELQRKDQRLEQLVDQLLGETGRRPAASVELLAPLTRREQQVLELLVDGLTNREIALRLVVEPDTVKDHVQSIIKKLGATDRTHAAVIAVRGGLVS